MLGAVLGAGTVAVDKRHGAWGSGSLGRRRHGLRGRVQGARRVPGHLGPKLGWGLCPWEHPLDKF